LSAAVAQAFASHSCEVIWEIVRQLRAQGAYSVRFTTLVSIMRPWLSNIELKPLDSVDDDDDESFSLRPVALDKNSLLLLRCMLYTTAKAARDAVASMQDLWAAIVDDNVNPGVGVANMRLIIRYMTGLLAQVKSSALLGFMRRISVFLSRSTHGRMLVHRYINEVTQPAAFIPLDSEDVTSFNLDNELGSNEPWVAEILSLKKSPSAEKVLVSTGGLAIYYLGALSYEMPTLITEHRSLSVLLSALFSLAYPERWVRDAARALLVNLVASERALCTVMVHGDGADSASAINSKYVANETAHIALGALRSEECLSGFGNVEAALTAKDPAHTSPQAAIDPEEFLLRSWSPAAMPGRAGRISSLLPRHHHMSLLGTRDADSEHKFAPPQLSGINPVVDAGDTELVAAIADIPVSSSSLISSPDFMANEKLLKTPATARFEINADGLEQPEPTGGREDTADQAAHSSSPSTPAMRRRSSATSRRSFSTDYMGSDASNRERATLQLLLVQLCRLFGRRYLGFAQEWADLAVQWAMSCPVRPLACLSLQVFSALAAEAQYGGTLVITPTRRMVLRLVDRLSNVVGDPSPDISAFSETVLAALKQTAGLAARMCAEDDGVKADLLASSLSLMCSAQTTGVYLMALGIFERIFPLVESEESRYRRLVFDRMDSVARGYQPALLHGLEFVACRERCLKLIRDTLKYDMAAQTPWSDGSHPLLALAAHLPVLIEECIHNAASVQQAYMNTCQESFVSQEHGPSTSAANSAGDSNNVESEQEGSLSKGNGGGGKRRLHNYRRQIVPPSFTPNLLGSSLGLVFGSSSESTSSHTSQLQQHPSSESAAPGATSALADASLSRLQLFRRRGHGQQQKHAHSRQASKGNITRPEVTDSSVRQPADRSESSSERDLSSLAASRTSSVASALNNTPQQSQLQEKYLGLISRCSRALLLSSQQQLQVEMKETSQLMQRILSMLSPPPSTQTTRAVADLSHEMIQQFGYAVAESGHACAAEIIGLLLLYLQPSGRARMALKLLRDEQAQQIISNQPQAAATATASNFVAGIGRSPVYDELRRINVALQLLYSVVSFGDAHAAANNSGTGGGGRQGMRLDRAMLPSLKYLFDLVIVARPISDTASRVLHVLLQKFDEFAGSSSSQTWAIADGSSRLGSQEALSWFESDSYVLLSSARHALSQVVALGLEQDDAQSTDLDLLSDQSDIDTDDEQVEPYSTNIPLGVSRSASPEMPTLVIPGESTDDLRVEKLALRYGVGMLSGVDGDGAFAPYTHDSAVGQYTLDGPERNGEESGSAHGQGNDATSTDSEDGNTSGGEEDLLAQLDAFDKVLDEALLA
ncbi:Cell morphogenesis protein PAG1, partial [Dipsacomyces acuminosporus]